MGMNWDEYFLKVCKVVASNSKCLSRQIGAIIVKDKSIISTGYNGPPRGVSHCGERYYNDDLISKKLIEKGCKIINETECPRRALGYKSGEGLDICIASHSERNCIVNAARHGISIKGGILYANCPIPCSPCLVEIINSGIEEVVVTDLSTYDSMGEWLVKESKLKVRKFGSE